MISPIAVAVHVLNVVALQVQETLTNPNSLGSFLFRLVKVWISEIIHLDNYVSFKCTCTIINKGLLDK